MKHPHIREAKTVANRIGADSVIVIAFKDDIIAGSSYGRTKSKCAEAGKRLDWLIDIIGMDMRITGEPRLWNLVDPEVYKVQFSPNKAEEIFEEWIGTIKMI